MGAIETRTSGLRNTIACLVHDCPFGEYVRTISNTVISATIVGMLDTWEWILSIILCAWVFYTEWRSSWKHGGNSARLPKYFTPLHLTVAELHVIIVEHLGIGNTSRKERPTSRLAAAAAHCLQQYILPLTPVPSLFNLRIYLHRDSQKRIANL